MSLASRSGVGQLFTTISPAARRLGVSADQTRRYFDTGVLRGVRLPTGQRLVDLADLERLVAERAARGSTAR